MRRKLTSARSPSALGNAPVSISLSPSLGTVGTGTPFDPGVIMTKSCLLTPYTSGGGPCGSNSRLETTSLSSVPIQRSLTVRFLLSIDCTTPTRFVALKTPTSPGKTSTSSSMLVQCSNWGEGRVVDVPSCQVTDASVFDDVTART